MTERGQETAPRPDDRRTVAELIGLLWQTGEGMTRLSQDLAEASDSHSTDMSAVSLLARSAAPLTVGELGEELGLSKAATTALVDRLEDAGHVQRVRDTSDRRRWHLQVTQSAHELARAVLADFLQVTQAALADYTPEELAAARRFLLDVRGALDHRIRPGTIAGHQPTSTSTPS